MSGTVLERYEYDAYGNPYILDTQYAPHTTSLYGNPYLFTGRRVDILDSGSLKIQYNRNRYYDYYAGRWLTHDPLGITPNCRKPNEFRPFGQYKDALNLYEMMNSNPVLGNDPWGLSAWMFFEACISKEFRDILKELKKMADLTTVVDHVIFGGGYPYGHCMWSCEMTKDKDKGKDFAEEMGKKKEELDEAFADWADTKSDSCWKKWPSKRREKVAAWVCSADQTSDREDNAAGRDCGSDSNLKALPCWECCVHEKKIARDTPEGDKKRPFGPRCQGRYRKEVEKILGRSVVVENPN